MISILICDSLCLNLILNLGELKKLKKTAFQFLLDGLLITLNYFHINSSGHRSFLAFSLLLIQQLLQRCQHLFFACNLALVSYNLQHQLRVSVDILHLFSLHFIKLQVQRWDSCFYQQCLVGHGSSCAKHIHIKIVLASD